MSAPAKSSTLTPVKSSNIAAIGHQDGWLYVKFHPGKDGVSKTWRYRDAAHHHDALIAAESPGRLFHRLVKGAYFGSLVDG
jgi:hypothetical protein